MKVLLWAQNGLPNISEHNSDIIIMWRNYANHPNEKIISIYSLIDKKSNLFRHKFLLWIYSIGQLKICHQRIVDHLLLRPEFSAWWSSLLAEKCNFSKSPQIDDAIKLIAFINWALENNVVSIKLESTDKNLAKCLNDWCRSKEITFIWKKKLIIFFCYLSKLLNFFLVILCCAKAVIWLLYYVYERWDLRGVGLHGWKKSEGSLTFISYLINFKHPVSEKGIFNSFYWGSLPDKLSKEGTKLNWLHLYVKSEILPTAKLAAKYLNSLNTASHGNYNHVTLDSFLSLKIFFRTLKDWYSLAFRALSLNICNHVPKIDGISLWPLFVNDWNNSFIGIVAIRNALYINIFESIFKVLPKQKIGIYLLENMDWEFIMLYAWKASGHNLAVGSQHSTVRYWDLRYFSDIEGIYQSNSNHLVLPDFVAINGKEALKRYQEVGFPKERLIEVEALRYLYLYDLLKTVKSSSGAKKNVDLISETKKIKLLVLGEYNINHTKDQLQLLNEIMHKLPKSTEIFIKPHPSCPINVSDYPNLPFSLTPLPLFDLLPNFDVVYTGAVSSSVVDAYFFGLKVIAFQDQKTLNMSPLFGRNDLFFVKTSEELLLALNSKVDRCSTISSIEEFFYLDNNLPRWMKLIRKAL
jgi:surface carbohydrate biosynthesis protein (TIGR04326 family)